MSGYSLLEFLNQRLMMYSIVKLQYEAFDFDVDLTHNVDGPMVKGRATCQQLYIFHKSFCQSLARA
jgi:hypothetical protein